MNRLNTAALLASVVLIAAAPAVVRAQAGDPSVADITAGFDARVQRDIATLRIATTAFHDLAAAQAVGYPTATPMCVQDSTMGGMGQHYLNRALYDDTLDIAHPEMIIYAPMPGGKLKLVGVEYVVPFRLRPSTATPPRLFGQELKRHEEFKYWYLHVWAWEKNPAGLFSDWNPLVKC
ncbi:MAG: hypothetical protein ABJF01_03835 [bacterium]